jgi:cation diffusion facilitator CzcD-associated flavoprotein CzcO
MKRVGIIGSGPSGLAHADVLARCGFSAVIFERHSSIGGVWAQSYPPIRVSMREHIHFEPARSCAVNTRYQQYIDIMLADLGVSPYRKLPNLPAEIFAQYGSSDYATVVDEWLAKGDNHSSKPLDLPT